jgi:Effector Associated Constant Component 1
MSREEATTVRILCANAAEAGQEATSLRRHLVDADLDGLHVDLVKEDKSTQDGGATLLLLMSAPVINTLALGIADWIRKRRIESTLELDINGTKIKVSGDIADHSEKVQQLVAALQRT